MCRAKTVVLRDEVQKSFLSRWTEGLGVPSLRLVRSWSHSNYLKLYFILILTQSRSYVCPCRCIRRGLKDACKKVSWKMIAEMFAFSRNRKFWQVIVYNSKNKTFKFDLRLTISRYKIKRYVLIYCPQISRGAWKRAKFLFRDPDRGVKRFMCLRSDISLHTIFGIHGIIGPIFRASPISGQISNLGPAGQRYCRVFGSRNRPRKHSLVSRNVWNKVPGYFWSKNIKPRKRDF